MPVPWEPQLKARPPCTRLEGFEPPTRGLEGRRSSAELQALASRVTPRPLRRDLAFEERSRLLGRGLERSARSAVPKQEESLSLVRPAALEGQSRLAARSHNPETAVQRESLSLARGVVERASPEGTVLQHGPVERSALSDARRLRRPVAPGRKEPPAEQARGVTGGIRTHDHRDHNPGLYQLSYGHRAPDSVVRPGRLLAQRPDYRRLSDQC